MEELRRAAEAYYKNSPKKIRREAKKFFKSVDTNKDNKITLAEFVELLQQTGYQWIHPSLFSELDQNHDGSLDFWEVLTLYYLVRTRHVCCKYCRTFLTGLYFTCVECFNRSGDTYDLCSSCYGQRKFRHNHSQFSDSYVLLRSSRPGSSTSAANTNPPSNPQSNAAVPVDPAKIKLLEALNAIFDGALPIAGALVTVGAAAGKLVESINFSTRDSFKDCEYGCSIM